VDAPEIGVAHQIVWHADRIASLSLVPTGPVRTPPVTCQFGLACLVSADRHREHATSANHSQGLLVPKIAGPVTVTLGLPHHDRLVGHEWTGWSVAPYFR
jgi:hypothetical protein